MSQAIEWIIRYDYGSKTSGGGSTSTVRATSESEAIQVFRRTHPSRDITIVVVRPK